MIAVAAAVVLASVAVAFMLRRAEVQSDFTPAVVTCAVREKVNGVEVTGSAASGSVKSDITLPQITLRQNWLDGGNGLYYYALPVEPRQSTTVLCEPMRMGTSVSPTGAAVYQQITVLAEAVQALPGKAAQEAWGVTVKNGRITAVK